MLSRAPQCVYPTPSPPGVCTTHLFSGALGFLGADILLAISALWVNNLSPVSTSWIYGAKKSYQKHRSHSGKETFCLQPFQNSVVYWKGSIERTEFKKMETIHTFPFKGKGSAERHWGVGVGRPVQLLKWEGKQSPSEGILGQHLGEIFRSQVCTGIQNYTCISSKSLRMPDIGQRGPLPTPPQPRFLAQLTWFWFSHNLFFKDFLNFSRLGAKDKKGLQTKCWRCLSPYLHLWALTYQNNILANGSLPTDIQNVTWTETGLWSPKQGPDVSCHGALTIFPGQPNVGTITNLLALFPRKECGYSSSSIYPHYSDTRSKVQTLTLLSCQFWRR